MFFDHTHITCMLIFAVLPYTWKFSPISPAICSYWRNFYCANFLFCVNDYIEDMATFTALVKIYSTEYFCNTKVHVAGLGEIFVVYSIKFGCYFVATFS